MLARTFDVFTGSERVAAQFLLLEQIRLLRLPSPAPGGGLAGRKGDLASLKPSIQRDCCAAPTRHCLFERADGR